jgi:hypothetical protein
MGYYVLKKQYCCHLEHYQAAKFIFVAKVARATCREVFWTLTPLNEVSTALDLTLLKSNSR